MCVNQKRIHRAFKPFLVEHQRDFPLRWPLLPLRRRVVCSWIVGCRHLKSSNVFLELVWNQRHQESSYVKRLWHIEPTVWWRDFRKAGKLCRMFSHCKILSKYCSSTRNNLPNLLNPNTQSLDLTFFAQNRVSESPCSDEILPSTRTRSNTWHSGRSTCDGER